MARASKEKKIIVGSILREKRKAAGLKQHEVAKAISKSRSAYAYYETGVTMPDYDSLSKLSRIYNVPIEIFDGESENPKEVANQIKKEIKRLRKDGITDDEFEAARRSLYGKEIMSYNDIDALANGLVAAHFGEYDMFDIVETFKNVTKGDVLSRLAQVMDEQYSALSVVKQSEE